MAASVEFKDLFVGSLKTPTVLKCNEDVVAVSSLQQNHTELFANSVNATSGNKNFRHLNDLGSHSSLMSSPFDHELGQVIDNSASVLNKVAALCENEDLSDIELVLCSSDGVNTGRVFPGHKLILSCSSDVLRIMLTDRSWPDAFRPRVELHEEQACIEVFGDFLHYLYSGRVLLTHDTVLPVLMLADKYNVTDLQDVCCCYMSMHLVSTKQRNRAVSWLQYSLATGHHSVATACRQFVLCNFHKMACTNDFLLIDEDLLIGLIRQSELVVPDELTLFQSVSRWIRHRESQWPIDVRHDMVLDVLSHIRFEMIPPSMLGLVTADPIFADFADYFEERIAESLAFHSPRASRPKTSLFSVMFEPRNYTNELWGTTLSIEAFSTFTEYEVLPVFFSTPATAVATDSGDAPTWEWSAELFPKGVHFSKFIMIGLWRNLEVSGTVYDTVRLVVSAKSSERRKTVVSVLVTGVQDGVEYIRHVVERHYVFDTDSQQCLINDVVPFHELNSPNSPYLCGPHGNMFKIMIVIKPVYDPSSST